MNVIPDNFIVNSCEYTPVYLIPSTSVTQAGSYIIAPSNQDVQKPVADNLKTFYENSGNLESSLLSSPKPRILKKNSTNVVGNNLKLASFLLPKSESSNTVNVQTKQYIAPVTPVTNVIVKPAVTTLPALPIVPVTTTPIATPTPQQSQNASNDKSQLRVEIDRKIVRVGTIPNTTRTHYPRAMPKTIKPKEKIDPNPSKHTSVQLLKLGETYHSLNQLSEEQMKIVNKALKIFSDPEKIPKEPAYDPVTNTKFIYKVVSPRDLTVVGRNKVVVKKKAEIKRQKISKLTEELPKHKIRKLVEEFPKQKVSKLSEESPKQRLSKLLEETPKQKLSKLLEELPKQKISKLPEDNLKPKISKLQEDNLKQKISKLSEDTIKQKVSKVPEDSGKVKIAEEDETTIPMEPKVTRSGRTVKLPRQMRPSTSPQKPKKKIGSIINCFQCSAEFCSFYRLQRHYENFPTHIPARIHSNLFHCLLAIIKGGGDEDQANIFMQQLEHLIEKLKSLLPCLLKTMDGKEGKLCTFNEDIAKLFGLTAGKYSLNIDALNCVKDKDGHCKHNPAPKNNQFNADASTPSQIWSAKNSDEIANNEVETEDCARINSVDKWPTVTKRIWKLKQQKQKLNAKKMRLASENEQPIELGIEDVVSFCNKEDSAITLCSSEVPLDTETECEQMAIEEVIPEQTIDPIEGDTIKPKTHAQFRSTHFDIRSSPIKLPSALVRKFQLHPDKVTDRQVQILRPLSIETENDNQTQCDNDLQEIFIDNTELPKETDINNELNFDTKGWTIATSNEMPHESFLKSNILFETGLTPAKNENLFEASLIHVTDKSDCLFEPPTTKSNDMIEANLLEIISKTNGLIEPSLIHVNNKANALFESDQTLLHGKNCNSFYDTSLHVKPKCNSLIGSSVLHLKDKAFETALSHVKERSNNLFESTLLQPRSTSSSLVEPLLNDKDETNIFGTSLSHDKERPNVLFEQSLMGSKDSLLDPSLLLKDDSNSLFNTSLSDRKDDNLMEQSLVDHKSNGLIGQSLLDTKDLRTPVSIDVSQANNLGTNDSRLLSNQGQSVLNFLESLGNESLGLAYPETEIRNNSVDFHLDLFSFHNS